MKSKHSLNITLFFFLFSSWIGAYTLAEDQHGEKDRETVLDRKVHIEKDLILDIPQVPRWCDGLDLKKSRVNVGDCELYVEEEGKGQWRWFSNLNEPGNWRTAIPRMKAILEQFGKKN